MKCVAGMFPVRLLERGLIRPPLPGEQSSYRAHILMALIRAHASCCTGSTTRLRHRCTSIFLTSSLKRVKSPSTLQWHKRSDSEEIKAKIKPSPSSFGSRFVSYLGSKNASFPTSLIKTPVSGNDAKPSGTFSPSLGEQVLPSLKVLVLRAETELCRFSCLIETPQLCDPGLTSVWMNHSKPAGCCEKQRRPDPF